MCESECKYICVGHLASKCHYAASLLPDYALSYINSVPTMASNYIPDGIEVQLQSENGLLGMVSEEQTASDIGRLVFVSMSLL